MRKQLAKGSYQVLAVILVAGTMVIIPAVAHGATAIVTVTATVLRNLSVKTQSNLAFGALDTSASPGTIVLHNNGTRSATGGARVETGSDASPATLLVYGEPNSGVTISMAPSARLIDAHGDAMVVDHFQESRGPTSTLDRTGTGMIKLGATLHVKANQPLGSYTGTMLVTVNYN